MGVGVNATSWPLYPLERDPAPILQEVGWAAWPVWTGAENLAPPQPEFDSRNVQPIASRYTDRAISAHDGRT
jgi:hypothetical protein